MSTLRLNLDGLGRWSDEVTFPVEAARTTAYAAATNDDNPRHLSGELAPPVFACVPPAEALATILGALLSRDDRRWGLHASHDMRLHRPITPGMVLRSKAAGVGIQPKASGTVVVARTQTHDGTDTVNDQYITLFIRRRYEGPAVGEEAPDHRAPGNARTGEPLAVVTYRVDDDQTFRYADASGDRSSIHLDVEFARSVGLPGIIVHGLLTMALTSRAVVATVCRGDSIRLKRLAVRFARPVLPGQEITTRIWAAGRRGSRAIFAYDTLNPLGKAVIQDGLAEIGP